MTTRLILLVLFSSLGAVKVSAEALNIHQYVANFTLLDNVDLIELRRVKFLDRSMFLWQKPTSHGDIVEYVTSGANGEGKVSSIFKEILPKFCNMQNHHNNQIGHHSPSMVLDIGSNYGIYGIFAAMHGCQTYMFEIQPSCHVRILAAIRMNRLASHAFLVPFPVGNETLKNMEVDASRVNCYGTFRPGGKQFTVWQKQETIKEKVQTKMFRMDDFLQLSQMHANQKIPIIKIDTEGYEVKVLSGMKRLLGSPYVQNVIVELTPQLWSNYGIEFAAGSETVAACLWDQGLQNVTKFGNYANPDEIIITREHLLTTLSSMWSSNEQNDFHFRR